VIEPLKTSGDGFEMGDLNSLDHDTPPVFAIG
jgi:hypothetical protein